jgi:taurine dioxygenase
MGYETINVTSVTPCIGADVEGITLAKPLSNRQVEELHQALAEHLVLFFRNQTLDVDSHKRLGRYFGELHIHPSTPGPEGHPEILPIHADANSRRINGEYWHSDVSCDQEPPMGSILYPIRCRAVVEIRSSPASMRPMMRYLPA